MKTILLLLIAITLPVQAARLHPEKWYQEKWCNEKSGQTEVVMADRTRVDCLTDTHAIEVDFADKWAEAIGQALGYGLMTGKRAGILLIVEQDKHYKYWIKLNSVIQHYDLSIDTWIIRPDPDPSL